MKRTIQPILFVAFLLTLCTFILYPAQSASKPPAHGKKAIVYYPDYKGLIDISAYVDRLTHIQYAFIDLDANGNCIAPDPTIAGYLASLKASHPHLKLIFSVGGWELSDHFSTVARDATKRTQMISTCLTLVRDNGFDGIDIDWEHPITGGQAGNSTDPNDANNYVTLLSEFRTAMTEHEELSIAIAATGWLYNQYPLSSLAAPLNNINLMTYDFHGGWSSFAFHHTPLYRNPLDPYTNNTNQAAQDFLAAGVPAEKIVLGAAFYGRGWQNVPPGDHNGLGQNGSNAFVFTYDQITATVGINGYQRYWDDTAKAPYLYSSTANGGSFVTYDDAQSICEKGQYILDNNLGGLMAWEITHNIANDDLVGAMDTCLMSDAPTPTPSATYPDPCRGNILCTVTPTFTPTPTATPGGGGSCTAPAYIDGTTYNAGDVVSHNEHEYECLVGGWCTIGGAYEPGVGWAWENAWTDLGVCTAPPTVTPTPTATPPVSAEKYILAYYPAWGTGRIPIADLPGDLLTHIAYAFANVSADGECILGSPSVDPTNFADLQALKTQHPHLKLILSVGGWTWSENFSDAAATAADRQQFTQSCVDMMEQYGFDGLDIDWEFPVRGGEPDTPGRPEDADNYVLLLAALRAELDARGSYELSIAAPASAWYYNILDLDGMAAYLDMVNLMTYAFAGSWSSTTSLDSALFASLDSPSMLNVHDSVQAYVNAAVPAEKIVIGIPFFGFGWTGVPDTNNGLFQPFTGVLNQNNLLYRDLQASQLINPNYERHWESQSLVPWLYSAADQTLISYSDPESVCRKGDYVNASDVGGLMFWEITGDDDDFSLVNAIYSGIHPPTVSLLSPADGANRVANPVLEWSSAERATHYELHVATDAAFTTLVQTATVTTTSYALSGVDDGLTYYWRVQPQSVCGAELMSDIFSFSASAPTAVTTQRVQTQTPYLVYLISLSVGLLVTLWLYLRKRASIRV